MFNRIKERIYTIETLMEALLALLHRKEVVTRGEMQIEILAQAEERDMQDDG